MLHSSAARPAAALVSRSPRTGWPRAVRADRRPLPGNFRGAAVEVTLDGHVTRIRLLPDDPAAVAPAPSATPARRAHRLPGLRSHPPGTPATDALTGPARRYHPRAIRLTAKTRNPRPAPGTVAGGTGTAGIGITG